ncbi:hypothetical protein [Rhodoferax sp.]|uniref:hypothetical protein n=1 Tax=Rhodoferax sp. TaxID=50421 RepID=UPI00284B284D|nr:hypothetical protein [Rhodoferax sp.]MDR3368878.1 hypothetical protein [Rhodoferax sp.]
MQTHVSISGKDAALLNVRAPEDIEFLVKESEVLTGKPGRMFVIAGADRLSYRVQWHPMGVQVERLDAHGRALSSEQLLLWEFLEHSVIEALRAGQLFTPLVRRPG